MLESDIQQTISRFELENDEGGTAREKAIAIRTLEDRKRTRDFLARANQEMINDRNLAGKWFGIISFL